MPQLPTLKPLFTFLIVTLAALSLQSCDLLEGDSEGPNELGGNADIELTRVGNKTTVSFNLPGNNPAFNNLDAEATVIENRNGIVSYEVKVKFDEDIVAAIDTLVGTQDLTDDAKRAILDLMLDKYGATLDTTDKNNMTVSAVLKGKVTDAGIQEFVTSKGDESRPFTVAKYDASVGDEYTFTDNGNTIRRQVLYRSTEDDYQVGFWLLKVVKVKETDESNPLVSEIWYATNHKYGLVGIEATLTSGEDVELILFPPTL